MAKKKATKKSSLLAKYTLQYQKKPKSRVFAPLAETYRKLGMYDEALKILRDGLKYHPTYTLGYIVLSHVYHDQQNYELAYNTLRPFVRDNLENITLQKLFAEICINLGYLEEALQTFKYLLLINPKDKEVADQVKLLEDDLLVNEEAALDTDKFVEKRMSSFDVNEDDWIQVDFGRGRRKEDDIDDWSMDTTQDASPIDKFKKDIVTENLNVEQQDLNDEFFKEDYDDPDSELDKDGKIQSDPIITHTLVDLYCKQGHYDKALEILESILDLHPDDRPTINRFKEIRELMAGGELADTTKTGIQTLDLEDIPDKVEKVNVVKEENSQSVDAEESGHDELLKLVDSKKEKDKELLLVVKEKLEKFAEAIRVEATRKQLNL